MSGDSYNFGNVHGPVNAGSGSQYVAGRDLTVPTAHEALAEVAALCDALGGLRLTESERQAAQGELDGVREALESGEPDRDKAAGHLERFTDGLRQAGVLASAGTALVGALGSLAHWLGPLGAGVLALL